MEEQGQVNKPPPPQVAAAAAKSPSALCNSLTWMTSWCGPPTRMSPASAGWEPYMSRDDTLAYIAGTVLPHPYFQAMCLDGRPVGAVSVTWNEAGMEACRGELSYALGLCYCGRGLATEVVRLAEAEVFGERPELERVEALVYVENKASQRVLEKAGFRREGVLRKYVVVKGRTRDVVVFSRLSTDDDDS